MLSVLGHGLVIRRDRASVPRNGFTRRKRAAQFQAENAQPPYEHEKSTTDNVDYVISNGVQNYIAADIARKSERLSYTKLVRPIRRWRYLPHYVEAEQQPPVDTWAESCAQSEFAGFHRTPST